MKVEQEVDHIDSRRVRNAAIVGFAGLAAGIAAAVLLLHGTPAPTANPPAPPSADTSFILATERGITLRNEKRESLDHYGWVDRDAGVSKIPVERAMDLVAADAGR